MAAKFLWTPLVVKLAHDWCKREHTCISFQENQQEDKQEKKCPRRAPPVHVNRVEDFLDHVFYMVALGSVCQAPCKRLQVAVRRFQRSQQIAEIAGLIVVLLFVRVQTHVLNRGDERDKGRL